METTKTLGEIMNDQRRGGLRAVAVALAVVLYAFVLVYTGIHTYNLFRRTLPPGQELFALLVLACMEGAAILLPLAVHFWLAPGPQRIIGYALYGLNFAFVTANTVLDASIATAATIPDWLTLYGQFLAPAAPVVIGAGIALIFLLDPSKMLHDAISSAQAATIAATALQMRAAASGDAVNATITRAAQMRLADIVTSAAGGPQTMQLAQAPQIAAEISADSEPAEPAPAPKVKRHAAPAR